MTNLEIDNAYVGDTQVDKIYLGTDVVWPTTPPEPIYSAMPLTFEIISGGTITWKAADSNVLKTISYSKDNGSNWTDIISTTEGTSFSVAAGDKVLFKGENTTYATNARNYNGFSGSTAVYNVYGNIMSLVGGDNFSGLTTLENSYVFCSLFRATKVNDVSSLVLPATALTQSCYRGMFSGCTSLVNAPTLPATTLADDCYVSMFQGCTSLVNAPELPATALANRCYRYMFQGCTSLNYIKCLATDISASPYTSGWLSSVSSQGTFVKHPNTTWTTGDDGIPTGWTVKDADI